MRRALFLSLTACLALLVAAGLAGSLAESTPAASTAITPSPVYTAAQLGAPAGDNWLMHMGNLKGHRYSSLTQINKANVGTLKQAWHINLGTARRRTPRAARSRRTRSSPTASYYIQDADRRRLRARRRDGRHALEVDAARYDGRLQRRHRRPQPGVAVGEGKVFAGLRDGRLIALDQMTGRQRLGDRGRRRGARAARSRPLRSTSTAWSSSATARATTAAPAPTHAGLQGRTTARALWTWSAIPAPGQPGYKTWTNDGKGGNGSSLYGGGSFWESPLVDTEAQPAIFGTGNPEPWNSRGPGTNLYTDSIVALNLYTGQLVWYYQTGAPRPVGLGPAEQRRHVHRQVQGQRQDGQRVRPSPT